MKRSLLAIPLALAIALAGCGTQTVSKNDVQDKAQTFVDSAAKAAGQKSPKVKCDDDLEAKKGKSIDCPAGQGIKVTVTVTEIKDDKASLGFEVKEDK
jgi:hypothetical protein